MSVDRAPGGGMGVTRALRGIVPGLVLPVLALAASARGVAGQAAGARPAAGATPAAAAASGGASRRATRVVTLSNGLRLLCRPNTSSEIVSIVCLVRAGLPDESEEQAGLAALTGESLIRGTTAHTDEAYLNAITQAGGNLRVVPGFDLTEISIVTSRERFEAALKLMAHVVARPRFAPEAVKEAQETLKKRAQTFQDDFTGATYQTLVSQLYPNTPYGRAMSGYPNTLEKLTVADVKRFWEANYVQNRMVIAIVGDVDVPRAMNQAQKTLADLPFRPAQVTPTPRPERLTSPRLEMIQRNGPAAQVMVGFLAPPADRTTYPVYALLDAIVGGGKRARLFKNIREKHSLGYELGSFYQPLKYQSHMVGYVITPPYRRNPRTEQPESVIELVKGHAVDQYRQLAATGPTPEELARAKAYVIGRYALRQERTRDQAKWLAWNVAMGLGADFDDFFATKVQSLTKEELQAAAQRTLTQYALVVTMPDSDPREE